MIIRWTGLALILLARTACAITAEPLSPPTRTPETLAQSLVGSGISISNVTFVGDDSAAGVFVDGTDSVGFATGIVLSSGAVAGIAAPNDADDTSTEFFRDGDPDLDSAIPGFLTFDAAVLEFDFVPAGPEVTFRYVFASEEYNEFVNSEFNDVFGFFVNGVNLARLPDATTIVSINTVNAGNPEDGSPPVNPAFFVPNDCSDGPCPVPFEADGATVVLTLKAAVNPGVTNHLKLAIADAGDLDFDSWVFIEAQSLTLTEDCHNGIDDDGDQLVDNADPDCQVCGDGDLDPGETCDDHNLIDGDGCSSTCSIEPPTTTSTSTTSSSSTETTTSSTSTSTTGPLETSTTTTVLPATSSSTSTLVTSTTVTTTTTTSTSTTTTTTSTTASSSSSTTTPTTSTTSTTAPTNHAPDCSGAKAALLSVGPPNHRMVDVPITGVVDPDHDPVSITVTGITQDEPVDGQGDGSTCPDAAGVGTDTASIRAERAGGGDGRVYHLAFRASDGRGGTCTGTVTVCVPHDAAGTCGDGAPLVDATGPANCPGVDTPTVSPLGGGAVYPVTVTVPADVQGQGNVKIKAQLFLEPPTSAATLGAAGAAAAAQTSAVAISKPLKRVVKPGARVTFNLKLSKHGRQLLEDVTPFLARANITVKRRGLEPTDFEAITAWVR
jgi:cysteine-rich repeat protein